MSACERCAALEQALRAWTLAVSLPDCQACAVLDAELPNDVGVGLRPAAACTTFEPCLGTEPPHNFTCELLCITCGLPHEKHAAPQESEIAHGIWLLCGAPDGVDERHIVAALREYGEAKVAQERAALREWAEETTKPSRLFAVDLLLAWLDARSKEKA